MARKRKKQNRGGSAGQNRSAGEAYLKKNGQRPDVAITDSGLQIEVLRPAQGRCPGPDDTVKVQQRISLVNGTVLDDTYKSGEPARFDLNEAIPGYAEGLQQMPVGGRQRFVLHWDLAWGKKGTGQRIGPCSVLIIDAALLAIVD